MFFFFFKKKTAVFSCILNILRTGGVVKKTGHLLSCTRHYLPAKNQEHWVISTSVKDSKKFEFLSTKHLVSPKK